MYRNEQSGNTKVCFQHTNFIKRKSYLPCLHSPGLPHLGYIQFSSSFLLEKRFPIRSIIIENFYVS